jgi:hypothetical protein
MSLYKIRLKRLLTVEENALFKRLNTPAKIQDYLDSIPKNFESQGDTLYSPRLVMRHKTAHCLEAAAFAAAVLAYYGKKPLLLDLQSNDDDDDHVVTLFNEGGYWGAISKTNYATLRWRDPVYKTVRELAMSFFHEYYLEDGVKTMLAFSKPFDLRRYEPEEWVTTEKPLDFIAEDLDASPHSPASPVSRSKLRRVSPLERKVLKLEEWKRPK